MWNYQPTDTLCHHGILGMKWKQHRVAHIATKISSVKKAGETDVKSFEPYTKSGISTKNGKMVMSPKDVNDAINGSKHATEQTVSRLESKQNKIQSKLDSRASKHTQDIIKKMSTGEAIAKSSLLGSYGALVYTGLKGKHVSKGQATVQAIINGTANNFTLGILGRHSKW